jgi:benzoyl-CoA reductase/2-hydroxyglutaryl-CoA dehydratase subunit BcrC/BadD/HgdB
MSRVDELLDKFVDISQHPHKAMLDYKARTGKDAVGVFPVYAPEEIVYAAGYLPVGMWGSKGSINKASQSLPSFACSIMQIIMENEMNGVYDDLKAVLVSSPCDTLKAMGQKYYGKCPAIQFVHSQNRDFKGSDDYMTEEYKIVCQKLEEVLGVKIDPEKINEAIEIYNENRAVTRMFTEVAALYPQIFTPKKRHAVLKARTFMDKAENTVLLKELIEEVLKTPVVPFKGKKVVLTGIMAEPDEFLDILEEYNVAVVADDLAQESRQFRTDVPAGKDPFRRLAVQWRNVTACSLATDRRKPRGQFVAELSKKYAADAVIFCQMKFCDPEEFDYPMMMDEFKRQSIPCMKVEIDLQAVAAEQLRTRVQSFVEML